MHGFPSLKTNDFFLMNGLTSYIGISIFSLTLPSITLKLTRQTVNKESLKRTLYRLVDTPGTLTNHSPKITLSRASLPSLKCYLRKSRLEQAYQLLNGTTAMILSYEELYALTESATVLQFSNTSSYVDIPPRNIFVDNRFDNVKMQVHRCRSTPSEWFLLV